MSECVEKTIISQEQFPTFNNGPLTVGQLLSGSESPERSIAVIHLNGENHRVKNGESNAIYMVIGGVGYFTIWNSDCPEVRVVRTGDSIKIPAGTPYKDVGVNLLMVSMNCPAFDARKVIVLD